MFVLICWSVVGRCCVCVKFVGQLRDMVVFVLIC